jgi:uncharacterized protein (TIGR00375 family)
MRVIADFHIHSKYSRATSSHLDLDLLAQWARYKGIALLGTGDATHPIWLQELEEKLEPTHGGLYQYRGIKFILTAEVNNRFFLNGKLHQIHNLLFFPDMKTAKLVNQRLSRYGDLYRDGRPTLKLSAKDLVRLVLDVSKDILVVPAHAWTPWFSIFGAHSGFDAVEECFEDQAGEIFCLETGLSSDPAMNWRLSRLDRYTLISNSDSHSAQRIGREANVFDCEEDYTYPSIVSYLKRRDPKRFLYTIEFFPEEGKYHFDGHRQCKIRLAPEASIRQGNRCSVCGRKVTIGVMHRVMELADRPEGYDPAHAIPFQRLVPLDQIIAEVRGVGVNSKAVEEEYLHIVQRLAPELEILLDWPEDRLRKELSPKVAEGILRVRQGDVEILPGYDGEYGQVHLFKKEEGVSAEKQLTLFE